MLELVVVAWLLGLTLAVWSILFVRRPKGRSWVQFEARSPVPWGLLDVFLALGLLVFLTSMAVAAMEIRGQEQLDVAQSPAEVDEQLRATLAQCAT